MAKTTFVGGFVNPNNENLIKSHFDGNPYFSSDPLQKDIIWGIYEETGEALKVYSTMFYPQPRHPFYATKAVTEMPYGRIEEIPFFCCKIIQHFSKANNLYKVLREQLVDGDVVIAYSAYFPFLMALSRLKRKKRVQTILVVPDLPTFVGLGSKTSLYRTLSRWARKTLFNKYNNAVDAYVFLTQRMNGAINPKGKPYVVVEGIAPNDYHRHELETKRKIVYSGTLQMKYGIGVLLEAIPLVHDENVRFEFYGSGEGEVYIRRAAEKDHRIVFGGSINREELHRIQQESLLLINPRQNNEEFTKYSFPSKTMEYMLSGRPIIAYMLDGMPSEYAEYLVTPEDDTPEALAKAIEYVMSLDAKAQKEMGEAARSFVLKHKNHRAQARRILTLVSKDI